MLSVLLTLGSLLSVGLLMRNCILFEVPAVPMRAYIS